MNLFKILKKYRRIIKDVKFMQQSFSQYGEDLIMDTVRQIMQNRGLMREFCYLDIGANQPKFINNTYWLYRLGFNGVLVEPNKKLADELKCVRSNDVVLNVGITISGGGGGGGVFPFYKI
jgi:hypothetical protein